MTEHNKQVLSILIMSFSIALGCTFGIGYHTGSIVMGISAFLISLPISIIILSLAYRSNQ